MIVLVINTPPDNWFSEIRLSENTLLEIHFSKIHFQKVHFWKYTFRKYTFRKYKVVVPFWLQQYNKKYAASHTLDSSRSKVSPTYVLTWVGARDTCVSRRGSFPYPRCYMHLWCRFLNLRSHSLHICMGDQSCETLSNDVACWSPTTFHKCQPCTEKIIILIFGVKWWLRYLTLIFGV